MYIQLEYGAMGHPNWVCPGYMYTIRVWGYGPPQLGTPHSYVYTIRVWGYEPPQLGTPRSYVYTINNERWGPFWGLPVHIAILQQVIIRNIYAKNNNDI